VTEEYHDYDMEQLLHHWGSAYLIFHTDGRWLAQRRDNRATVRADDPDKLHRAILADYNAHPVPR
jgi:hypothetical protein